MKINKSESHNIEFKQSWRDEYLKWICAFANTEGGTLYIGVTDKGEVCGVEDSHKLTEDIPNKIRNTMGLICDVKLLQDGDKDYFEIKVQGKGCHGSMPNTGVDPLTAAAHIVIALQEISAREFSQVYPIMPAMIYPTKDTAAAVNA